ncbi:MAG: beta-ketoacyl-ACP synthase II [Rhodocyclaceae bacterium]|nr:beta-ketoacyl-ACP synthase II [Rhodocyclaceae bacterium]MCA3021014.1 beta-ketoacyl-ACP synthase II [Rhodocyclaceae bacterium]MCA3051784.1 beta-ketoacyl-ACP synthase II [Rhodocyclaceae bacterium]MCA3056716.1 beta-ketoacyl-ACP synthase II [Rhodocyclaceae bacterium]
MSKRRVVITGLGIVSPVGNTVAAAWDNIVNGRGGIGPITRFDAGVLPTRFAAEVKNFNAADWMSPKEVRRMDTFIHFGLAATKMALDDSGIVVDDSNSHRIGVNVGSGIGGLPMIEDNIREMIDKGPRRLSPFFVPGSIINMVAGLISIQYGVKGPNVSMVSACTTATHCIGDAGRMIEYGDADIMIAGGAEATICMAGIGGFCAVKALSERNDSPETASRPFDRDRDGFVLGEGAGILVLEEYEHAKARGARIYGELAAMGMSADANHITAPSMDGPRRGMLAALHNAGINGDEVQYLNAHGTSTPLGDKNETAAVKAAFGDHAKDLVVNSTKSMTGHLLGAAGGVEAVFTTLAIYNQISPPTINIFDQDPECDLDYCANVARDMKIDVALSNSFGFGGTNGTLVMKKLR